MPAHVPARPGRRGRKALRTENKLKRRETQRSEKRRKEARELATC